MPLNDYLYHQYILYFPCLCLVLNGVVVSIGNFKDWGLGFEPRQSQNNLCSSFFSYFFENAPGRPGGLFDPVFSSRTLIFDAWHFLFYGWSQYFASFYPNGPDFLRKRPLTPPGWAWPLEKIYMHSQGQSDPLYIWAKQLPHHIAPDVYCISILS